MTKEFLTGGRNKAGFVHVFYKRCAFIDFDKVLVCSSNGRHVDEGQTHIFPRMTSIQKFEKHFAGKKSAAAIGAAIFVEALISEVVDDAATM